MDFANIRAYPPGEHGGIIVLRVKHQDEPTVLEYVRRKADVGRVIGERKAKAVTDKGSAVSNLNELEYIHGEIYANQYQTDRIARISPSTGRV